jgi:pimeloyl-ACP methyl ester carboxylesterase
LGDDEMKYVLLHGMGQNASSWDKTISLLSDDTETVCPELSDFFTEGNCFYNKMYAAFCDYCNNFSELLNLCGLSLGAVLALNYAIDFPKKVNSLILIAPQYDMPKFLLKVQNVLFKFMPESQFKDIGLTKKDFITLTNSMADMDFTNGLDKVTCPVLILCGEKDNVNKKAAIKLAEKLPNAKFATIENSGHEVNIDNPQGLAKVTGEL